MIRAYAPWDRDAVVALVSSVLDEYGLAANIGGVERDLADVARGYGGPRAGFWVAVDGSAAGGTSQTTTLDGAVVGTVAIRPKEGATCELKRLYVSRAARGRGVGRALYAHAEAFARAAGYERIWLDSSRRFVEARRLYEKNGFVLLEERDDDPRPASAGPGNWCDNVYENVLVTGNRT